MPIIRSGVQYSGKWTRAQQMQAISAGTWTGITQYELYTWGDANQGRLGHNNIINLSSPVQVGSLTTWSQASGGNNFSAAIQQSFT